MAKRKISPTLRAYNKLRTTKKKMCQGKATKTDVNSAASSYVSAAVKAGQKKTEATRKANRVKKGGCSTSSYVAKKKKK